MVIVSDCVILVKVEEEGGRDFCQFGNSHVVVQIGKLVIETAHIKKTIMNKIVLRPCSDSSSLLRL